MILFVMSLLLSVSYDPGDCLSSFGWLNGVWKMEQSNGKIRLETWKLTNDGSLIGSGMKVTGGDTILLEHLQIECKEDQIKYIATVPDQNNALPVEFLLVSSKDHHFIFENKLHDFPQRIIYNWVRTASNNTDAPAPGDSLFVRAETISGDGIDFVFIKQ